MNRIIGSWLHSCRLVLQEVREGGSEKLRAIAKRAKRSVAVRAQDSAYSPRAVVMVKRERPWVSAWSRATRAFANCACATLTLKDSVVFGRLYAKFLAPMAVSGITGCLFAVLLAPLRLFVTATRPTEALKAIDLCFVVGEFRKLLQILANAAPLHSIWSLGPVLTKPIVPVQISTGLTLDPTKALSVPCGDLCRPSASALANSSYFFCVRFNHGIHSFVKLNA